MSSKTTRKLSYGLRKQPIMAIHRRDEPIESDPGTNPDDGCLAGYQYHIELMNHRSKFIVKHHGVYLILLSSQLPSELLKTFPCDVLVSPLASVSLLASITGRPPTRLGQAVIEGSCLCMGAGVVPLLTNLRPRPACAAEDRGFYSRTVRARRRHSVPRRVLDRSCGRITV